MSHNSYFGKKTSIHFIVKNISPINKKLTIMGQPLFRNQLRDLLSAEDISESDIKESLIKGELAHKIRVGDLIIISTNIDLTTFDEEQKQFLISAGANIGFDPNKASKDTGNPFIQLAPLENEPPPNSYFFDVDGTPSYTDENGDPHNIGSGGDGGGESVDQLNAKYLRGNVLAVNNDEVNTGNTKWSGIYHYKDNLDLTIFLVEPSNGNIVDIWLKDGVSNTRITDGEGFDVTFENYRYIRLTYNNGWSYAEFEDAEDKFINAVNGNAVRQGLETAAGSVKFNYQRLNQVAHPVPTYNHGVPTVGWAKGQFLRTLDVIVLADENADGNSVNLDQKTWQAVVQVNKDDWSTIYLPSFPNYGDIVDVYVEQGAVSVYLSNAGGFNPVYSGKSIHRITYNGSGWGDLELTEEEWIKTIIKHNVNSSGIISSTYFEGDAHLSGTYIGDIIVDGDVYIDSYTFILGSLLVNSYHSIYCDNGSFIIISKDCNSGQIDLEPQDNSIEQSPFVVNGNLTCSDFYFPTNMISNDPDGNNGPGLYVNGNCEVFGGNIHIAGSEPGSNGGRLFIGGKLSVISFAEEDYIELGEINLYGGDSDNEINAGKGGDFVCFGDVTIDGVNAYGGSSYNFTNVDAGDGGNVTIYGTLVGGLSLDGGVVDIDDDYSISTGNAGNAGYANIYGDYICWYHSARGGYCVSGNEGHYQGNGGSLYVGGDIIGSGNIILDSGGRYGELSQAGDPYYGYIYSGNLTVDGNLIIDQVILTGGSIETTNFSSMPGDNQGSNGGTLTVQGNATVGNIETSGGNNDFGHGGSGGWSFCKGDLTLLSYLKLNGGSGGNGHGGSAGYLSVNGSLSLNYCELNGGNAFQGNGGNAGSIEVKGDFMLTSASDNNYSDVMLLVGGNCESTSAEHFAGVGGGIIVYMGDFKSGGMISLNGGNRTGSITSYAEVYNSANGGNILIETGNLHINSLQSFGGSVNTPYKNVQGGNSGTITVSGDMFVKGNLTLSGGSCTGNFGGIGGTINCGGKLTCPGTILMAGGEGLLSELDEEQQYDGNMGNITIKGGCDIFEFLGTEGEHVNDALEAGMFIAGYCNFGTINMPTRNSIYIKPAVINGNAQNVSLMVYSMPNKTKLNIGSGEATEDISSMIGSSIFKYSNNANNWYQLEGTPLNGDEV